MEKYIPVSAAYSVSRANLAELKQTCTSSIELKNNKTGSLEKVLIIDIYIDRWVGWFLNIGQELKSNQHSKFVALMIASSFFEGHARFLYGVDTNDPSIRSGDYFEKVFVHVLEPVIGDSQLCTGLSKVMWLNARNGLFHVAEMRYGVRVADEIVQPFLTTRSGKDRQIWVNPFALIEKISDYLAEYRKAVLGPNMLRGASDLRESFDKGWLMIYTDKTEITPAHNYHDHSLWPGNLSGRDAAGTISRSNLK